MAGGIDAQDLQSGAAAADEGPVGRGTYSGGAFGPLTSAELRRLGRFGGVLMIVGALTSIPAGLALDPAPHVYEHLIGLSSALLGVVAFFAPWERLSSNWLHVGMIVAMIEIAAGVAILSDDYAFFYVLVAMFAAYVIRDQSVTVAYAILLGIALLAPLAYSDEDLKEQLHHILVTLPVLVIAAAIVRYLRDTLEDRERQYRAFADEAVSLAERIRGGSADGANGSARDLRRRIGALATDMDPDAEARDR